MPISKLLKWIEWVRCRALMMMMMMLPLFDSFFNVVQHKFYQVLLGRTLKQVAQNKPAIVGIGV